MNKVKEAVQKVEAKASGTTTSSSSSTSPTNNQKGLILVTGATSFVGTWVIRHFLAAGYAVRGQVRNEASAAKVHKVFPRANDSSQLTTVVVPDITVPGAFDAAVGDVTGVVHTASPFVFKVQDNERDLLDPAVKGTTRVLEAVAAHAPSVRRVVVTSSFAAILDPHQGARPGYTYTEKDWNPTPYAEAAANTTDGEVAYCASKTFAERAAWDFVAEKKPHFTVATVNPPMVYGPVAHDTTLASLNTSVADIHRFLDGSQAAPGPTAFPAFADVRDVAEAHLRAFEHDQPGRYLICSGNFEYRDVCRVLREVLPADRRAKVPDPEATPSAAGTYFQVDNSQTGRDLGMTFRSLHDSIRDTALSLLALEEGKTWDEVSKE